MKNTYLTLLLAWSALIAGYAMQQTVDESPNLANRSPKPKTRSTAAESPPLFQVGRRSGPRGFAHEMSDEEHVRLAEVLSGVEGGVVLSGYRSELYEDLYRDWTRVERLAVTDRGQRAVEVLWRSPNTTCRQRSLFDGDLLWEVDRIEDGRL